MAITYLGIDLGTSGLRALLVDAHGQRIGTAERQFGVSKPFTGWSEQNPEDWILALESVVGELRQTHTEFKSLHGIGVAGHMHGATLLDRSDNVLRPCILWNDTRSASQAARLDSVPAFRNLTGNIVFPGFTAPKLEWVRENEPEIFEKVAKVLLPAAFINRYLTGEYVADFSDSAGTSWLDVGKRAWSDELLHASGMRRDQMPKLVEGSDAAGVLQPELALRWGLGERVVVAGGAGDNAAAACGIGAMREGQGFISLGTSGVILAARDGFFPDPTTAVHTFCHAVPSRWYQMGVMLAATDCLNWLAGITGKRPADLTAEIGDSIAPSRLIFLPYLSGERTPHNNSSIRGSFVGISGDSQRTDLTRAVLEGVAFGLRDSFDALKATGAQMDHLLAIGGGSASRTWLRLISTVLNIPLAVPADGEFGAALGAARLGMSAATGQAPENLMTPPEVDEMVEPELASVAAFEDAYRRFQSAYPAIKSIR